jgi:dihydrofolate reductase
LDSRTVVVGRRAVTSRPSGHPRISHKSLKTQAERDLTVGGPDLAAQAIKAGLVDEFQLFLMPIVVGGGNQALPDHVRLKLELLDERRFGNGVVHLRYATRT